MPVLLAAALLVFLGGIAAGGSGTPDPNLIGWENPSAQTPDPTGSAPQPDPTLRICIHKRLSRVWKWEIMTIDSAEDTEIS